MTDPKVQPADSQDIDGDRRVDTDEPGDNVRAWVEVERRVEEAHAARRERARRQGQP
jgi:hypothetical protein